MVSSGVRKGMSFWRSSEASTRLLVFVPLLRTLIEPFLLGARCRRTLLGKLLEPLRTGKAKRSCLGQSNSPRALVNHVLTFLEEPG